MFLVAAFFRNQQAGLFESRQLPLDCSTPDTSEVDDLRDKKALFRLPEQQAEQALLGSSEKRVGTTATLRLMLPAAGSSGSDTMVDMIEIPAKNVDEPRFLVIGKINNKHWSAITTYRNNKTRIISVRRSRKQEIDIYESL